MLRDRANDIGKRWRVMLPILLLPVLLFGCDGSKSYLTEESWLQLHSPLSRIKHNSENWVKWLNSHEDVVPQAQRPQAEKAYAALAGDMKRLVRESASLVPKTADEVMDRIPRRSYTDLQADEKRLFNIINPFYVEWAKDRDLGPDMFQHTWSSPTSDEDLRTRSPRLQNIPLTEEERQVVQRFLDDLQLSDWESVGSNW